VLSGLYGAQCTPDFCGFNAQDELQYCGRLDASRMTPVANAHRELFGAMKQAAETGHGPVEQTPSMGCSIKWRGRAWKARSGSLATSSEFSNRISDRRHVGGGYPGHTNSSLTLRPSSAAARCRVASVTLPSFGSSKRLIWLRLVFMRSAKRLRESPCAFIAAEICQARISLSAAA
jgi:hypothetical protein